MTPEKMIELTRMLFAGPFPYKDCRALNELGAGDELIPDLDLFFSDIAGFAQDPKSIFMRSSEQINRYTPVLSQSFFARFPEHRHIARYITPQATPELFEVLSAAEAIRPVLHEMLLAARKESDEKGESA